MIKNISLLAFSIFAFQFGMAAEFGPVIEEGINDSLLQDTIMTLKLHTCTDTVKDKSKDEIVLTIDNVCKQLDNIKKYIDIIGVSIVSLSTTLKLTDNNRYSNITKFLDGLAIYSGIISENIPKMKIEIKKVKTKIKMAKSADELLTVNEDIITCIDKINEYAKAFDIEQNFTQNYLVGEIAPIIELLKKYFTSCIGMLEKLPDQIDKYIESLNDY